MKKTGQFKEDGGVLVWEEVRIYAVEDTGAIFLTFDPAEKEEHIVYKLQHCTKCKTYAWYGLWNTCACAGVPCERNHLGNPQRFQNSFASMQEAIQAKLKQGWVVKRMSASDVFNWSLIRAT